eukprot:9468709-Pyramimonas_sp.AAC.2
MVRNHRRITSLRRVATNIATDCPHLLDMIVTGEIVLDLHAKAAAKPTAKSRVSQLDGVFGKTDGLRAKARRRASDADPQ